MFEILNFGNLAITTKRHSLPRSDPAGPSTLYNIQENGLN
jgi:hypothetical protein